MKSPSGLLQRFESDEIEGSAFPHGDHVQVAWGLSRRYPPEEALSRLAVGIQRMAERAGRPGAYHETITRAWFALVSDADDLHAHPELFDKTLLSRYYSPERLAAGREKWLEPDLNPLRLPAPPLATIEHDRDGFPRIRVGGGDVDLPEAASHRHESDR